MRTTVAMTTSASARNWSQVNGGESRGGRPTEARAATSMKTWKIYLRFSYLSGKNAVNRNDVSAWCRHPTICRVVAIYADGVKVYE